MGFGESVISPRASDGCLQSWRRRSLPRAPTCFSFGSDLKTCLHITRNMATQLLRLGFRQAVRGIFAYLAGAMRAAVQQGSYDCIHSTAMGGIFPTTTWERCHFGRLHLTWSWYIFLVLYFHVVFTWILWQLTSHGLVLVASGGSWRDPFCRQLARSGLGLPLLTLRRNLYLIETQNSRTQNFYLIETKKL